MKKSVLFFLLFTLSLTVFIACQKETSFENAKPAVASLKADSTGDCLPKIVKGIFVAGRALGDGNTMEIEVDVTTPGSYSISTDTVNGYFFKGTGNFANAGINKVTLKGSGTPLLDGTDDFTLLYGTSVCIVPVDVLDAGNAGPAVFRLGTAPGVCPTVTPAGTYSQGAALTGTNNIQFGITVTSPGVYTISSDTVNGFYFSSTGSLINTGIQNVTLNGAGTPLRNDTSTFTLRSGALVCTFKIAVSGTTPPPPPPPPPTGNCADTVLGNYVTGTPLNATNKVQLRHTYLTAGTFIITTPVVNGYSFKDTVIVNTAGTIANIELNGAGTPASTGINTFAVAFGDNSTCSFTVTVSSTVPPPPPPPPVATGVYFPLTTGSYWTYGDQFSGDTIKRAVVDSVPRAGNNYKIFVETDMDGDTTQFFYRRAGNDYFEYAFVDNYSLITFKEFIFDDILFLKETLTTNQTWFSKEWTGTDIDDSTTKKLRYSFRCVDANATVNVGGKSFTNTYKVNFKPQTAPGNSSTFTDEGLSWDAWYAKGTGLVMLKVNVTGFPVSPYELFIRNWVVR